MHPEIKNILKMLGKNIGKSIGIKILKSPKLLILSVLIGVPLILISILFLPFILLFVISYYLIKFFKGKDTILNNGVKGVSGRVVEPGMDRVEVYSDNKNRRYEEKFDKKKLVTEEETFDVEFKKK